MNATEAIVRTGTSQASRPSAALEKGYFSIEERSISDLLHFVRELAGQLRFYDSAHQEAGTWQGMFDLNPDTMEAFMEDPEAFLNIKDTSDPEGQRQQIAERLSQPHRALFLVFLKLVPHLKERFSELTQQHLDLYYQEVLKIPRKEASKDRVHLLFGLAEGITAYTLTQGTLLDGGTDAAGTPLHYALDQTFTLSQAELVDIRTVRMRRQYQSLNDIRELHVNGFEVMLRQALGQYFQGDELPSYPQGRYYDASVDIPYLQKLAHFLPIAPDDLTALQHVIPTVAEREGLLSSLLSPAALQKWEEQVGHDLPDRLHHRTLEAFETEVLAFKAALEGSGDQDQDIIHLEKVISSSDQKQDLLNQLSQDAIQKWESKVATTLQEHLPASSIAAFARKVSWFKEEVEEAEAYVTSILGFVTVSDFLYCMDMYERSVSTDPSIPFPGVDEWVEASERIEAAFDQRWRIRRMERMIDSYRPGALKNYNDEGEEVPVLGRLERLFEQLFGQPDPGNRLPPFPAVTDSLESLYEILLQEDGSDRYALAARYISQSLGFVLEEFQFFMDMHQRSNELYGRRYREILQDPKWERAFQILERTERNLRELVAPAPGRWDVKNIQAGKDIRFDGQESQPAFGLPGTSTDLTAYYQPGLAVVSSLLHLEEGIRSIQLEIACKKEYFPMEDLQLAREKGTLQFEIGLSGAEDWTTFNSLDHPNKVTFVVETIGEDLTASFAPEEVLLICGLELIGDTGKKVIFSDGSIWEVMYAVDNDPPTFALSYLSTVSGISGGASYMLPDLSFTDQGTPLIGAVYIQHRQEVVMQNVEEVYGAAVATVEQGDYLRFFDGQLVEVREVLDKGTRARVRPMGYLPVDTASLNERDPPERLRSLAFRERSLIQEVDILTVKLEPEGKTFGEQDLNRILHFPNGLVLELREPVLAEGDNPSDDEETQEYDEAKVTELEPRDFDPETLDTRIEMYSTFPGFRLNIRLERDDAAVAPPSEALAVPGFNPKEPALRVMLKNYRNTQGASDTVDTPYEYFANIRLHQVKLEVNVKGMEQVKIATDDGVLKPGGPFELFGRQPHEGASFYFGHPELSRKKLDSLDLQLTWIDLPDNFQEYYAAYTNSGLPDIPTLSNSQFKAQMDLYNVRSWQELEDSKELFQATAEGVTTLRYATGFAEAAYEELALTPPIDSDDPREERRYFRLQLQAPDFQHKRYPQVIRRLALDGDTSLVNEPYTPSVSTFTVGYSVSEEITPDLRDSEDGSFLTHLHPFGALNVRHSILESKPELGAAMLPLLQDEGALYLGLSGLEPGQEVSLLFQLVPGTGDAASEAPRLHWYYRTLEGWKAFPLPDLLDDTTSAMTYSGIVRLRLPEDASDTGPLMPSGHHWIAVHAPEHAHAAAHVLNIHPRAASATLVAVPPGSAHVRLPGESITAFVAPVKEVPTVLQPYSSFGGKQSETDAQYYTRVSERLSHKGRAVVARDHEQLVLEKFPEIAHVKCLNSGELDGENSPGALKVVVVPDLTSVSPFRPLTPGVAPELLEQVQKTLTEASAFANELTVQNAVFERVLYRVAVRFNPGYGQGIYRKQTGEDLIRYLSPWAGEEQMLFGNQLYLTELIYFLENLPYVDYVAVVKGYREEVQYEGTEEEELRWIEAEEIIQVSRPDALLVSNSYHVIDVISGENFRVEDFMGIGYMIIELDNIVR